MKIEIKDLGTLSDESRKTSNYDTLIAPLLLAESPSLCDVLPENCGEVTVPSDLFGPKPKSYATRVLYVPTVDGKSSFKIIVVYVGDEQKKTPEIAAREYAAIGAQRARAEGARSVAIYVGCAGPEILRMTTEGIRLGLYRFNKYLKEGGNVDPGQFYLVSGKFSDRTANNGVVKEASAIAESTIWARDAVNEPANVMTVERLADGARQIAEQSGGKIECSIYKVNTGRARWDGVPVEDVEVEIGDSDAARLKDISEMGSFIGVGRGSAIAPRFVHLTYRGNPNSKRALWFVGKSIVFDTGGLSLKPPTAMIGMKGDMGGGATVLGTIKGIAELGLEVNVNVLCAIAENMPSGSAQRPGDVVRAMDGSTIEVDNTDAEGRLTMADAIAYARSRSKADGSEAVIVDIATLTGAVRIALGRGVAGLFSNDDNLARSLETAAKGGGELIWRMPLDDVSKEQNRSPIADIKNTGGMFAGATTAAHFLGHFAGDTPWAHIDIAGTSILAEGQGSFVKGANGSGVRTLIELARIYCLDSNWARG